MGDGARVALIVVLGAPIIGLFVYSLYQLVMFIHHWHSVVTNVRSKSAMFLGPLVLLDGDDLSTAGKEHLNKARSRFRRFAFSIVPIAVFVVAMRIIESSAS